MIVCQSCSSELEEYELTAGGDALCPMCTEWAKEFHKRIIEKILDKTRTLQKWIE